MFFLLIFLPFLGFIGGSFFGRYTAKYSIYFTIINIFISCLFSLFLFYYNSSVDGYLFLCISPWIISDCLFISWSFFGDSLTFFMCFVVTFISLIVHLYSVEYMREDPHIVRFFCYLSLFTFFMLVLVTAANFVQMFVGWEGVGLSSYLLINFWFTRIQANKAAIKAMLFNRIADMFMLIGLFCIFLLFDTFDYFIVFSIAPFFFNYFFYYSYILDFICCCLFLGAMGKSAQIGFHNWLPDAMEGPTPVSALIHAATMVTAGVFLLIRCSFLFELSQITLNFIAIVGALTAFFGSSAGLFFHDLKRVIAFSTCSQLGYMILACGMSRFNFAFFHLVTHAFFKALLFLTAGAIIHSMLDEQDIRKMGGLFKYLPITYLSFVIGSLNLIGFPFLSGFYSKDLLLESIFISYSTIGFFCYFIGLLAIFFTSSYSMRIFILIFIGKPNYNRQITKLILESVSTIKLSIIFLSLISIFIGYLIYDWFCGLGSTFFGTSFFFNQILYNHCDIEFLVFSIKILPLIFMLFGSICTALIYLLNIFYFFIIKKLKWFKYFFKFLLKKWYSDRFVNLCIGLTVLVFCKNYIYIKIDRGLLEILGPSLLANISYNFVYVL